MSKVHITLVGGQPTPVYQGVLLSNPDKIILLCSPGKHGTQELANTIQENLGTMHYYNVRIESVVIDDVQAITDKLNILFASIPAEDELSINISSGTKIWSVLCAQLCPRPDAHIYCLAQNGKVLTTQGYCEEKQVEFDMFMQFNLLQHPLENYTLFSKYTDQETRNQQTIERLYQTKGFHPLLKQMIVEYNQDKDHYLRSDQSVEIDDNYIDWHAEAQVFVIKLGEIYEEIGGKYASSMLLNTGWFEYGVASMLAEIYGKQNVYTNCIFKSINQQDKNEVDVIVHTGQKLLFVECKTKIQNSTDIDKFHSVVKNYGGNGSKALFITMHEMDAIQQEKCNDNHIHHTCTYRRMDVRGEKMMVRTTSTMLKQQIQEFIDYANY